MISRVRNSWRLYKYRKTLVEWTRLAISWPEKKLYEIGWFDAASLSVPDFLIIGAPKAGTWWLAHNLAVHPEIFLATGVERGELHYFDDQFHKYLTEYAAYFRNANDKVKGEKTPSYCILPRARIQFIQRVIPSVKLIFIIRDPIERAWSHAMMDLVRSTGRSFSIIDDDDIHHHIENTHINYNYINILNNWLDFFRKIIFI